MEKEKSIFDPIAKYYDFLNRFFSLNIDKFWRKTLLNEVRKNINSAVNLNLLDLGCGTGDLLKLFYEHSGMQFSNIIGIDISYNMLEICKKNIRDNNMHNCFTVQADACKMPFPDNFFDIVVCAFVIRNINNIDTVFKEIHRVLKEGGIFSFLEFSLPKTYFLRSIFRNYLNLWIKNVGDFLTKSRSYSFLTNSIVVFDKIDLQQYLNKGGFKIIKFFYLTNGIVQLGVVKK